MKQIGSNYTINQSIKFSVYFKLGQGVFWAIRQIATGSSFDNVWHPYPFLRQKLTYIKKVNDGDEKTSKKQLKKCFFYLLKWTFLLNVFFYLPELIVFSEFDNNPMHALGRTKCVFLLVMHSARSSKTEKKWPITRSLKRRAARRNFT